MSQTTSPRQHLQRRWTTNDLPRILDGTAPPGASTAADTSGLPPGVFAAMSAAVNTQQLMALLEPSGGENSQIGQIIELLESVGRRLDSIERQMRERTPN